MKNTFFIGFCIFCIVCTGEVFSAATQEQMESMSNGLRRTCVNKLGITTADIEGIRGGNFIDSPGARCYIKCVMGLMKTFTKQGTIDLDVLVKQISIMTPSTIGKKLIEGAKTCYDEVSSDDPCELAWMFTKCTYQKGPDSFFFP
ncbi:hypothetical protein TKK_0015123 [Trichogramma kaykai]|uniref:Uncharacterized protein n=1 Tax=Trichogramma kaykai TaxID=54128 RepID=A0ABD2WBI0_9HYME